jgi:hypothetical protein
VLRDEGTLLGRRRRRLGHLQVLDRERGSLGHGQDGLAPEGFELRELAGELGPEQLLAALSGSPGPPSSQPGLWCRGAARTQEPAYLAVEAAGHSIWIANLD